MGFLVTLIRWVYQILAGLCALFTAAVLASLSFELPFKRAAIELKIQEWTGDPQAGLLMGVAAVVIALVFFSYVYIKSRQVRDEPSIAFDNPDGEVSISIRAIEDFVGRIGRDFSEVKNLDPSINARRYGVQIMLKVELWSGPNIPKLTERIQNVIKNQVQNILGIEIVQSVTLSVSQIVAREKGYQMPAQPDIFAGQRDNEDVSQPNIPYQS